MLYLIVYMILHVSFAQGATLSKEEELIQLAKREEFEILLSKLEEYKNELNINYEDSEGKTLLWHLSASSIVGSGSIETIEQVNAQIKRLHDAIKKTIKMKPDVNRADKQFGNTPLINAVKSKRIPVVDALIAAGADVNQENFAGETALDYSHGLIGIHRSIYTTLIGKGAKYGSKLGKKLIILHNQLIQLRNLLNFLVV